MYNESITLIERAKTDNVDQYGDAVYSETRTEVFADVKSVTRSEFYVAQTAGYDPQIVFVLADYYDYQKQAYVEYENIRYKIVRTYRKGIELELVCAHVDGEENG